MSIILTKKFGDHDVTIVTSKNNASCWFRAQDIYKIAGDILDGRTAEEFFATTEFCFGDNGELLLSCHGVYRICYANSGPGCENLAIWAEETERDVMKQHLADLKKRILKLEKRIEDQDEKLARQELIIQNKDRVHDIILKSLLP